MLRCSILIFSAIGAGFNYTCFEDSEMLNDVAVRVGSAYVGAIVILAFIASVIA